MSRRPLSPAVIGAAGAALGLGGVVTAAAVRRRRGVSDRALNRWHVLTVDRGVEEVRADTGALEKISALGDTVEVELRLAPGGRGTEIAVRRVPTDDSATDSPGEQLEQLRHALWSAKQRIETGEELQATPRSHGRRPASLRGLALDAAERHSDRGGVR